MNKRLPEEDLLLLACKTGLSEEEKCRVRQIMDNGPDWNFVIRETGFHQIASLFCRNTANLVTELGIKNSVPPVLQKEYRNTAAANVKLWKEFSDIKRLCDESHIKIVCLRGIVFAYTLYREQALRSMRDVDILIQAGDIDKIAAVFFRCGYREVRENLPQAYKIKHGCGTNFVQYSPGMEMIFNVHWSLSSSRPFRLDLPELWQRVKPVKINSDEVTVLSDEDNFLSLALHMRRHSNALALKFIVDMKEYLDLHACGLDWGYIVKYAARNHIKNSVYFSLYICEELFAPVSFSEYAGLFDPGMIGRFFIKKAVNRRNYFRNSKIRGVWLRFLLFDRLIDVFIYFFRVSLAERFFLARITSLRKIKLKH